jgi:hypothetical protein
MGCAFGGREGIVYTVGDKRKVAEVGLGNAVFGCRWDVLAGETNRVGDSGGGSKVGSISGGFEDSAAPNVALVGVRDGFRFGIDSADVPKSASSIFVCSVPMIS